MEGMVKRNKNFWEDKRVLVTGHEGFLGSWLAKTLVEKKARVIGLDKVKNKAKVILNGLRPQIICLNGNIADLEFVKKAVQKYRPQFIFHVAAEAIVGEANKNPLRTFQSNIQGTWNILEASKGKGFIEGVIVASSDKAYGSHAQLPYKETAPLKGEHPYDASKSCADILCRTYFKTFQVPVCITRCGNIFGPGDYHFSRIVPDAIRHVLQGKQFIIRSDGTFTRDYIYVRDIIDAYLSLAEKMKRKKLYGEAFNFSDEKPLSVLALFRRIVQLSRHKSAQPKILNKAKYEIRHQYLSSRKARRVLGWQPRYSLDRALVETINWYREHLN